MLRVRWGRGGGGRGLRVYFLVGFICVCVWGGLFCFVVLLFVVVFCCCFRGFLFGGGGGLCVCVCVRVYVGVLFCLFAVCCFLMEFKLLLLFIYLFIYLFVCLLRYLLIYLYNDFKNPALTQPFFKDENKT